MEAKVKQKYTDIKLAKGVCIDRHNHTAREVADVGVSTKSFGKVWFYMPKGKAIFKTYDDFQNEIRDLRIVNELLCYELSKQMGIRCAEYELACLDEIITGVVTYDVATKNEKLVNSKELFIRQNIKDAQDLNEYYKLLKKYVEQGYKVDLDKTMKDLYKICLFDSLTMQSDRNSSNVFFLFNEQNKTIKVAPLIDNEYAFNTQNLNRELKDNYDIYETLFVDRLDYIYKMITVDNVLREDSSFRENITKLTHIAVTVPEYGKIFKDFVKGFNVKKALKKLESQGVEVGPRYKEYLFMTEKIIKDIYKQELAKTKNKKQNFSDTQDLSQ
jgi:hypothetical protein